MGLVTYPPDVAIDQVLKDIGMNYGVTEVEWCEFSDLFTIPELCPFTPGPLTIIILIAGVVGITSYLMYRFRKKWRKS